MRTGEPIPSEPGRRKPIQHHRAELFQPVLPALTECDKKKVPAELSLRRRESLDKNRACP